MFSVLRAVPVCTLGLLMMIQRLFQEVFSRHHVVQGLNLAQLHARQVTCILSGPHP